MKKLSPYLAFLSVFFLPYTQAQVLTVHNPNSKVTVTNEQVVSWGQTVRDIEPGPVHLNFEGLGNLDELGQFYNGGKSKSGFSGQNYGVTFSGNALAIIDSQHGGSGNFSSDIMPNTVLFFLTGSELYLNVVSGFTGEISFYYSSVSGGTVSLYDGPDATGTMLTTVGFQPLSLGFKGDSAGYYDIWRRSKVKFSGTAKSVLFSCSGNQCAFDEVILGSGGNGKSHGMAVLSESTDSHKGFAGMLTTPQSQTMKGKLFLDGSSSLHLNVGSSKSKYDGDVEEGSGYNYFDFNFMPKAGYFFVPNFTAGLFMDIEAYSNKSKDESGSQYKGTTFIIGPFARYYVPVNDQFMPFAEAQVGFGVDNYKSRSSSSDDWTRSNESVFTYRLGGGASYFFTEIVGCDLFLGYQHDAYKYKDSGDSGSSSSKSIYGEFTMQLGIVVILDIK